jgi:hypothetical protein
MGRHGDAPLSREPGHLHVPTGVPTPQATDLLSLWPLLPPVWRERTVPPWRPPPCVARRDAPVGKRAHSRAFVPRGGTFGPGRRCPGEIAVQCPGSGGTTDPNKTSPGESSHLTKTPRECPGSPIPGHRHVARHQLSTRAPDTPCQSTFSGARRLREVRSNLRIPDPQRAAETGWATDSTP